MPTGSKNKIALNLFYTKTNPDIFHTNSKCLEKARQKNIPQPAW